MSSLLNLKVSIKNIKSVVISLQCHNRQINSRIQQIVITSLNASNAVMITPPNTVQSNR